ncbi:MAG: InlB B-repeat-containing protein [Defluviitaleaceae bacterium]|nr:InlB B-repeat-containing protein [Defluviitaleaceae bacterium]
MASSELDGVYYQETSFADYVIPYVEDFAEESFLPIRASLTSAIDDSPFVAYFNSETGRVSMYAANGDSMGYRYVEGEGAFWELVSINAEATSVPLMQRMGQQRVNSNISYATGIRNPEFGYYAPIMPLFDTGSRFTNVPFANDPTPATGRSVFVGGGFFNTNRAQTTIELWTFNFPGGMSTIDVFFTNAIGDDTALGFDFLPWSDIRYNIRFPGEPYGARVSSIDGAFNNVELRFFAHNGSGVPSTVNISFNVNGAPSGISPMQMTPGQPFGTLPTPTRPNHEFVGWFTALTGGTQVTSTSIVPSVNTTLFAGWTVTSVNFETRNGWSWTADSGLCVRRDRPFITPTFASNSTGIVEAQYVFIGGATPTGGIPTPFTVLLQRQNANGTWSNVRTLVRPTSEARAGLFRRTTFAAYVGPNEVVRLHISTHVDGTHITFRHGILRHATTATDNAISEWSHSPDSQYFWNTWDYLW